MPSKEQSVAIARQLEVLYRSWGRFDNAVMQQRMADLLEAGENPFESFSSWFERGTRSPPTLRGGVHCGPPVLAIVQPESGITYFMTPDIAIGLWRALGAALGISYETEWVVYTKREHT